MAAPLRVYELEWITETSEEGEMPLLHKLTVPVASVLGTQALDEAVSGASVEFVRPGLNVISGSYSWSTGAPDVNGVVVSSPSAVRDGDRLYIMASGSLDTTVELQAEGDPYFSGGQWKIDLDLAVGTSASADSTSELVLVPSASTRLTTYDDIAGAGSSGTGPYTTGTDGTIEKYLQDPLLDVIISKSGLTTKVLRNIQPDGVIKELTPQKFGGSPSATAAVNFAAFTALLNFAINDSEQNEVFIPSGTYDFGTNDLEIDGTCGIQGEGLSTKLRWSAGSGVIGLHVGANSQADDVHVSNLALVGQSTGEETVASTAVKVSNASEGFTARNVHCLGTSASAGWNNHFHMATNAKYFEIVGCRSKWIIGTSDGYGVGIWVETGIRGNISDYRSIQSATQGRHHIHLDVGTIETVVGDGVRLFSGTGSQILLEGTTGGSATARNTITDGVHCIDGEGGSGNAGVHVKHNATNNRIAARVYDSSGDGLLVEGDSTTATSANDNDFSGLFVQKSDLHGIHIKGASDNTFDGVRAQGSSDAAANTSSNVYIEDNTTAQADNNRFNGGSLMGTSVKYALEIASGQGNEFRDVKMEGGATGDYLDSGTSTLLDFNATDDTNEVVTSPLDLQGGALLGANSKLAGHLDADGYQISDRAWGFQVMDTAAQTASLSAGTWALMPGTSKNVQANRMSLNTAGRITYDTTSPASTRPFLIIWSVSIQVESGGFDVFVCPAINGTVLDTAQGSEYEIQRYIGSGGGLGLGAMSGVALWTFDANDYVELYVKHNNGTSKYIQVDHCNLWVMEV